MTTPTRSTQPVSPEQALMNLAGMAADLKAERDELLALVRRLDVPTSGADILEIKRDATRLLARIDKEAK